MGPRGSGKATLASRLAAKYNFISLNINQLSQREKLSASRLARRIKGKTRLEYGVIDEAYVIHSQVHRLD